MLRKLLRNAHDPPAALPNHLVLVAMTYPSGHVLVRSHLSRAFASPLDGAPLAVTLFGARMEFVFELLLEILLQISGEVIAEVAFHSVGSALSRSGRTSNPALAAIGHGILGAAFGGLSVLAFPHAFITNESLRIANLIFGPLAAGSAMAAIGALRRKRGAPTIRLESFAYGAFFAFAFSLVRFLATR